MLKVEMKEKASEQKRNADQTSKDDELFSADTRWQVALDTAGIGIWEIDFAKSGEIKRPIDWICRVWRMDGT